MGNIYVFKVINYYNNKVNKVFQNINLTLTVFFNLTNKRTNDENLSERIVGRERERESLERERETRRP